MERERDLVKANIYDEIPRQSSKVLDVEIEGDDDDEDVEGEEYMIKRIEIKPH